MAFKIKDGGVWKDAAPSVKHSGAWKTPSEIFAKENGTWKSVWQSATVVKWYAVVQDGVKNLVFMEDTSRSGGADWVIPSGQPVWPELGLNLGNAPSGHKWVFNARDRNPTGSGWIYMGWVQLQYQNNSGSIQNQSSVRDALLAANASALLWNDTTNQQLEAWGPSNLDVYTSNISTPAWYAQNFNGFNGGNTRPWDNPVSVGDLLTFSITIPG